MVKWHFLRTQWSDVNLFGSYDHLMIVYLVAMETLNFKKKEFFKCQLLQNHWKSMTSLVRKIQKRSKFGEVDVTPAPPTPPLPPLHTHTETKVMFILF